ncbi:hypothetical protein [Bradyrhizobium sp. STM 3557]|uniref:hypothetical protein n=1 Tax=Bradyrhizobium sp. STM 3557 TaxID=578920 RepID=UPI00389110E3
MSKPISRDPSPEDSPAEAEARRGTLPTADRRPADAEMARILKTTPLRMALDPTGGAIAHWKHGAVHDALEPMTEHVVTTYTATMQRMERRSGRSLATGMARSGVVAIIPAGSSARWDIFGPVNVVQLYLPHATLERVAGEADLSLAALASDAGLSRFHFCRAWIYASQAERAAALASADPERVTDL